MSLSQRFCKWDFFAHLCAQYYSQCTRLSTHPTKDQGHYSYTDQKLRHQLTYYCTLFDFPSAKDQVCPFCSTTGVQGMQGLCRPGSHCEVWLPLLWGGSLIFQIFVL